MRNQVTLTESEEVAVLMLLKSITYEGLTSADAIAFQATLFNLGERIVNDDIDRKQFGLWKCLGEPSWVTEGQVRC